MFNRVTLSSADVDSYIASIQQRTEAGVHDKGIFKAIFLAGGPGSGKSHLRPHLVREQALRVVDSDILFKMFLNIESISLDFNSHSPEDILRREELRTKAGTLLDKRVQYWIYARLGLVIDMTAKDVRWVKKLRQWLVDFGYDTYMIFVNTDEEVAVQRNLERSVKSKDRTLPEPMVREFWKQSQNNMGALETMFESGPGGISGGFRIVDNSDDFRQDNTGRVMLTENAKDVRKAVQDWVRAPVRSNTAKRWIRDELAGKKNSENIPKLPA